MVAPHTKFEQVKFNYLDRKLDQAIGAGWLKEVETWLRKGAGVNKTDITGTTPLMRAVIRDQYEIARLLINKGAALDEQDREGDTALSIAATSGNMDMVKLLLANGADCTIKNNYGKTPFEVAEMYGKREIFNLIMKYHKELEDQEELENHETLTPSGPGI